jgi:multidrug resistance efflux pump
MWLTGLVGLALAGGAGCAPHGGTVAEAAPAAAESLVVRRGTLRPAMLLTGELEAVDSEPIHVPRTRLWQLPIRWMEADGARVHRGQRVLELDNSQFTGDLEQRKLVRSSAENDLNRKRADVTGELADKRFALEERRIELEKARIEAAVPEALLPAREYQERRLALSRAELAHAKAAEDLETVLSATEAEIEELSIALRRAEDEIVAAETAIGALAVVAPRDGILIVAENPEQGRKFQVGDNAWVGLAVMSIPDLSRMQVAARLSDVDDGRVTIGSRAVCTLDAYPDRVFEGQVTEIAPIAQEEADDSLRRSFRVVLRLEEADPERMRPGMSVRVEVQEPAIEQALIVPRAALDLTGDEPRALFADGGSAAVRLGPCTAVACVVADGLVEGARLRAGSVG